LPRSSGLFLQYTIQYLSRPLQAQSQGEWFLRACVLWILPGGRKWDEQQNRKEVFGVQIRDIFIHEIGFGFQESLDKKSCPTCLGTKGENNGRGKRNDILKCDL
jgi:hypothetical protein